MIKVGDKSEFIQTERGEKLIAEVAALHRFDSFAELYRELPLLKCGYTEADIDTANPEDMDLYYTPEQQRKACMYLGVIVGRREGKLRVK